MADPRIPMPQALYDEFGMEVTDKVQDFVRQHILADRARVPADLKGREPDAEFLRLLALCETGYYTATRALDVPAVDVEQCRAYHARARADLIAHVYGVPEVDRG